jgi:hypothetical protein
MNALLFTIHREHLTKQRSLLMAGANVMPLPPFVAFGVGDVVAIVATVFCDEIDDFLMTQSSVG